MKKIIATVFFALVLSVHSAKAQENLEQRLETIESTLERLEEKVDRLTALHSEVDLGDTIIANQDCPGDLLDKVFFIICHNPDWKTAFWVGYHLTELNLRGDTDRTDNFRPDPEIVVGNRAELADYRNSGFDRGHMAPAAAFKRSHEAMSTTFLLSNMAPQTPALNRRIWRDLEDEVRDVVRTEGEAWIFTGNLFLDSDGEPVNPQQKIGNNEVAVPTHNFKIILLNSGERGLEMFAFRMPNQRDTIHGDPDNFLFTVDEIERQTGIDFFSFLPDSIESDLEGATNSWPLPE